MTETETHHSHKEMSSSSSSSSRSSIIRHSSSSKSKQSKLSRLSSKGSMSHFTSAPEFGNDGLRLVEVDFKSSHKFLLVVWAIMSGVMHLIWYNSVLQIGPTIVNMIPGYNPAPIWLPTGSLASLCGNLTYYFLPRPVRLIQMIIPCIGIMALSFVFPLCLNAVVDGGLSQGACTGIVAVCFFLMEYMRGFIASQNYGTASFFRPYGAFAQTISIGLSVGEGVSGIFPWLVYFCHGLSKPSEPKEFMVAIWISSTVNVVAIGIWMCIFIWVMKKQTSSAAVFKATCAHNDAARKGLSFKSKVKTFFKSFKGTKMVGLSISLCFASTLNLYPNIAPLGFSWVSIEDGAILLGLFTLTDPVFRCLGFLMPKLMKGWVPPKMLYIALVVAKMIAFLPPCLMPYYAAEAPSWMDSLGEEIGLILMLAISQGSLVVLGIYTYFNHLPVTENIDLASSLVTIYVIFGVTCGQILFLIYPAFK